MIVWTGWGILVPFVGVFVLAIVQFLFKGILPLNMASALAYAAAGAAIWFLGKKFNKDKGRVVIDKETKQEIFLKGRRHTLFFIPFQYWAFVPWVAAVISIFTPINSP